MLTYQDFEKVRDKEKEKRQFIASAINAHKGGADYKLAETADAYNKQKNTFIMNFAKRWYKKEENKEENEHSYCQRALALRK